MTFKGPFQPQPFRDATIHLWLLPPSSEALPVPPHSSPCRGAQRSLRQFPSTSFPAQAGLLLLVPHTRAPCSHPTPSSRASGQHRSTLQGPPSPGGKQRTPLCAPKNAPLGPTTLSQVGASTHAWSLGKERKERARFWYLENILFHHYSMVA